MDLSEKIKKIREDKNLTQDEMAERISVTRQAISKWERGVGYPSLEALRLISNEFGVSLNDLLEVGKQERSEEFKPIGFRNYLYAMFYFVAFLISFGIMLTFNLVSAFTSVGLDLESDVGLWFLVIYNVIIGIVCLLWIAMILFCVLPLGRLQVEYNDFGIRVKTLKGYTEIPFEEISELRIIMILNTAPGRLIIKTPRKVYRVFALKDLNHVKTVIDEVKVLNRR
ncbi:MAG: helix-turn-helix domain-containing protein [Bacillota bacterium]|nr:helix-turn-helix domain-containing protein [Bacillota bacterium]